MALRNAPVFFRVFPVFFRFCHLKMAIFQKKCTFFKKNAQKICIYEKKAVPLHRVLEKHMKK